MQILFVGEEPSKTAKEKGWVWGDEQLCSKTLLEALDKAGVHRESLQFINLFEDGSVNQDSIQMIKDFKSSVIGMGNKVQRALTKNNIGHHALIHPAARGKIRKTELYQAHVKKVLSSIVGG